MVRTCRSCRGKGLTLGIDQHCRSGAGSPGRSGVAGASCRSMALLERVGGGAVPAQRGVAGGVDGEERGDRGQQLRQPSGVAGSAVDDGCGRFRGGHRGGAVGSSGAWADVPASGMTGRSPDKIGRCFGSRRCRRNLRVTNASRRVATAERTCSTRTAARRFCTAASTPGEPARAGTCGGGAGQPRTTGSKGSGSRTTTWSATSLRSGRSWWRLWTTLIVVSSSSSASSGGCGGWRLTTLVPFVRGRASRSISLDVHRIAG